jgi:hypothetical protein
MDDLGPPVAWTGLPKGVPVYTSDGAKVGKVEHVLGDTQADIFDGIVVDTPGPGHRFADEPQVAELHEHGVVLALGREEARNLPEPSANPGALVIDPADAFEPQLVTKLRRAWDLISGNY